MKLVVVLTVYACVGAFICSLYVPGGFGGRTGSELSMNFKFSCGVLVATEKAMAPHSSTLAWKIPWTEEPGRLQSTGSLGVGHD